MAEVSLHNLNKYFDTTHVVKNVDLQIRDNPPTICQLALPTTPRVEDETM